MTYRSLVVGSLRQRVAYTLLSSERVMSLERWFAGIYRMEAGLDLAEEVWKTSQLVIQH